MDESKHEASSLEPRVATLESELRQVVKAVGDLASGFVRVEGQLQTLALTVERVGAPKKTEWFAIAGTGISLLLMAITLGGLVLYPITQQINAMAGWRDKHIDLEMHPVGKSRIDALEKSVLERAAINAAGIRELDAKLQVEMRLLDGIIFRGLAELDERLQREMLAMDASTKAVAAASTKNFDDLKTMGTPALRERITVLETLMRNGVNNEK